MTHNHYGSTAQPILTLGVDFLLPINLFSQILRAAFCYCNVLTVSFRKDYILNLDFGDFIFQDFHEIC